MIDDLTIEVDERENGLVRLTFIYSKEYIESNPDEPVRLALLFGVPFLIGEHFETKSQQVYIFETLKDIAITFLNGLKNSVKRGKPDIEKVLGEYSV